MFGKGAKKKKKTAMVTGTLQFRAWKIPSVAECEGVKGFLKHKSAAEKASQNKVNTPKVVADEDDQEEDQEEDADDQEDDQEEDGQE